MDIRIEGYWLKNVERAYLAGIFDGEGCASVTCGRYKKKTKMGEKLYSGFGVHFAVSNVDQGVLKDILSLLGKGGIYRQRNVYSFRSHNPTDVLKIIGVIKPYVKVKRQDLKNLEDAAEFILQVRETSKRHRWTEEEKTEFLKFAEKSKALKGSGKRGRPRKYPLRQS